VGAIIRASALFLAGCLVLGGCRRADRADPARERPPASAAASAPPAPSRRDEPPLSRHGEAIALSPDEKTMFVADEEHEALFLVPTAATEPSAVRVVRLPGPPAEVVALPTRVLVTIRSLPTAAARTARDAIRGPVPEASKVAFLPVEQQPPPGDRSAETTKRAELVKRARTRPRNTRPNVFDPSVVRQSEGGLLLVLAADAAAGLVEVARVALPPDAWGLAVTPDEKRALVTSAWSATVSAVDIERARLIASVTTPREPRGVVIAPDGVHAYVSHLVGSGLTELVLGPDTLTAREVPLPAARARAVPGVELAASLGYDLVLSPDAESIYVPRHALGADGIGAWWGAPTVDVLDRASEEPVAPLHRAPVAARVDASYVRASEAWEALPGEAPSPRLDLVQPRAVVYRRATDTLLVASEGDDALTELDALAADPAMAERRSFALGVDYDPFGDFPEHGGGPAGLALSRDEATAFVYCRTTFDVAAVDLRTGDKRYVHLADDGLPADAAYGRRLFASARAPALSGGLGCAACHPEGRDDGFVWSEGDLSQGRPELHFVGSRKNAKMRMNDKDGTPPLALFPRQTPMLAGRMRANGPYGWHGESVDLPARILVGTELHRAPWQPSGADRAAGEDAAKLDYLADYLRSGLLPPPTVAHAPTSVEQRGKAIFESDAARCSRCHVPASEFTDRTALPLPALAERRGFDTEPNPAFKTPSLWFVAGTAPYFHDGSQATLEDLVRTNRDRMGNTSQLSADERAALVAYLRTL